MALADTGEAKARAAVDRTGSERGGGSVGLVLLIALLLIGAAAGFVLVGREAAAPYITPMLGVLAMIGVFLLFALAAGMLRVTGRESVSPLIKALVDGAVEGIVVTDARGRVIYANAAYLDLIGAAGAGDVRPVERVFIGDPGVSEAVYRLLKAAREGKRLQEEVRVGVHRGERGRWLRMRVRPLGEGKREAGLTVWSLADVTRELERHENVFQELQHAIDYLDHAPAGFFSAEGNGAIVYLNATLANWLDYDLAQFGSGGLRLEDIVAGEGAALVTALAAAPGEVRTEVLDIDLKTRSGHILPARLFHKVAFGADGAPGASRTLVINRARDDGSDPVRAAEVRFNRFFQNTPMAIATVDRQGRITLANARFERLFHAVLRGGGDERSIFATVAERERPALEAAIRKAAAGQGEIAPVEVTLAGAGERYASFFVTAIEEQVEGDHAAAIVYALETTAQRTLENQVNQQQKMDTIGRLAGNIAHDFNNLLGVITMATDFLLNAHKPTDPSFKDIMQIKQTANRAATLVRQLLAFSRKQTLRPEVVSLRDPLEDLAIVVLRRLIGENVKLEVLHGRDIWPVKVDIAQFEQVIINLAVNARDAMPGGGTLTLRTGNVGAEESARYRYKGMPLGEYVLVEVEDTGSGIAPDVLDKIFDPFYTTKEVGKGTGLGLSTVYGIIKQTGGFVYVESELGKGTIFRIFLPRYVPGADDVEAPQLPETTAPAIAGAVSAAEELVRTTAAADLTGQGTILLVEDEEGLRMLNARGLASRGYTVIEAGNGVEAIEKLERQGGKVDLVVSDVVMPEMDGPTLLKELRKRNPEVKIVFVSGYAEDAFEKNLSEAERPNFLAKPFTLKQLIAKVKETMTA